MRSYHQSLVGSGKQWLLLSCVALSTLLIPGQAHFASADEDKPETITIDGVVTGRTIVELTADAKQLGGLEIQKILPSIELVKKGQPLVWFETKPLDKKMEDAETALKLAELTLKEAEFDYEAFVKSSELDLQAATRKRDRARQDYDYYQKVDRPGQLEQAEQSLISSRFSFESAREEYEQLLQMYKEDDLTEESEEIVLRRAKRSMESAGFGLKRAELRHKQTLETTIPRQDIDQKDAQTRAMMEFAKASQSIRTAQAKRKLEIQQSRRSFARQKADFETMQSERSKVVINSPINGIFVHGALENGRLPAKPVKLKAKSAVTGSQVLGTVVGIDGLQIVLDLTAEQHGKVKKGADCKIELAGQPGQPVKGRLAGLAGLPYAANKFRGGVAVLENVPPSAMLAPCKVTLPTTGGDSKASASDKPAKPAEKPAKGGKEKKGDKKHPQKEAKK